MVGYYPGGMEELIYLVRLVHRWLYAPADPVLKNNNDKCGEVIYVTQKEEEPIAEMIEFQSIFYSQQSCSKHVD